VACLEAETETQGSRSNEFISRLRRIKELLSAPVEALIQTADEVKHLLNEVETQLPEALLVKLWPTGHLLFFRKQVEMARRRIETRRAQTSLRADIALRCQAMNEKKSVLDAKADTSSADQELEILRKKLAYYEARVRDTRQQIQEQEDSIATSKREANELQGQLKLELEELQALSRQMVAGEDKDDEAIIADADRMKTDALRAIDEILDSA
jgi:hypothetical protein